MAEKKKGLGGLSPEKKKKLKELIMRKAAEDLKNEALKKKQEKDNFINSRVTPFKVDSLDKAGLKKFCKEIYDKIVVMEDLKYDAEMKVREQEEEINQLNSKCNDRKGTFIKPVLRKVSKTDQKMKKLKNKQAQNIQVELKSTGKSKYALDEEPTGEATGEEAAVEQEQEEEEEEEEEE